jgi:hypothetical protein
VAANYTTFLPGLRGHGSGSEGEDATPSWTARWGQKPLGGPLLGAVISEIGISRLALSPVESMLGFKFESGTVLQAIIARVTTHQ